ncbi:MAG: 5'-nucleotidase C-terminal domain-containing protein [Halanaerobiales bacterium]|nr:5'-nucleotidase C-terminal domain-containing protein [Halanaerobiales bacterium]
MSNYLKRNHLLIGLLVAVFVLGTALFTGQAVNAQNSKIVILHTNDEHGSINNFAKIASLKQQYENNPEYDDVLLVSAGDAFSGNPVVDEYVIDGENLRGKPLVDLMNEAGYDVSTLGNHEFDYGQERLQANMDFAKYPMILANIEVDPNEADLDQPEPYTFIETDNGLKLAFLGVIQVQESGYPSTLPTNLYGLKYLDPLETVKNYMYLQDESDAFILLSHVGHNWNQELAKQVSGIDAIIGAHSHTVVEKAIKVQDTLIAQAGSDLKYLGKIVLTFDENNNVVDSSGELINLEDVEEEDQAVKEKIASYNNDVEKIFSRELAYVDNSISGNSNLGALMTDALTNSEELADLGHDVDFSFQNTGGIRVGSIGPGNITVGDIFELEPFGNDTIIYEMTTKQIKDMLANSYQRGNSIDLIPAGLNYEVIVNQVGDVKRVDLTDMAGNTIQEGQTHTVAHNQYVASSYEFEAETEGINTYIRMNDSIIHYLEDVLSNENLQSYYASQDLNRTDVTIEKGGAGDKVAYTEVDISTLGKAQGSVSAGNLFADAVSHVLDVDVGAFPSNQLATGAVYPANNDVFSQSLDLIYASFGYDNNITVATVTGSDLEDMLLSQARYYGEGPVMTHVSSGVEYTVEMDGNEITDLKVYIDGKRVDPNGEYTFAVNSYVWQYYAGAADPISSETTSTTEKEVLVEYLREIGTITDSVLEERITIE